MQPLRAGGVEADGKSRETGGKRIGSINDDLARKRFGVFAHERFGRVPQRGQDDELGVTQSFADHSGAALRRCRGVARAKDDGMSFGAESGS